MARKDKDTANEDFFSSNFVEEVKPEEVILEKPVLNKSGIQLTIFDFIRDEIRGLDAKGNMYRVKVTKDTKDLKAGESFWL